MLTNTPLPSGPKNLAIRMKIMNFNPTSNSFVMKLFLISIAIKIVKPNYLYLYRFKYNSSIISDIFDQLYFLESFKDSL